MTTKDFIIALFVRIETAMKGIHKHSQANLYPSEVVTLGILFSLKGAGSRAFYRWVQRDWLCWFPKLPEPTRLFRLFKAHRHWTHLFLVEPTIPGGVDRYRVELLHPCREVVAQASRQSSGAALFRYQIPDYERGLESLRPQLDDATFTAMNVKQAMEYALGANP